ncbi:hypothetical protein [Cupriavidus yeoncheonensis]|uniref:hypothetical protein n=1 Tax=Cupriavidus yeoncheonensis TaxID=1462994 RepID=UPI001E4A1F60|nr:hypothetical protein [Cupriavidus yeoncheonensis]
MTGKDSNDIARVSLPFFMSMVVAIGASSRSGRGLVTWLPGVVMQKELGQGGLGNGTRLRQDCR